MKSSVVNMYKAGDEEVVDDETGGDDEIKDNNSEEIGNMIIIYCFVIL
jgi:hypothetical protein